MKGFPAGDLEERLGARGAVSLARLSTTHTGGVDKDEARRRLERDQEKLDLLQQKLYAGGEKRVLLVLQAMDTGGKDGTIRGVMRSINPQGVHVASFKKPTPEEASHHYLWRIKKELPYPGRIGIFNRSHYEDILVPTVYKTLKPSEIEPRYDEINDFEKTLAGHGCVILKFFLHISKAEQKRRLQDRLDDPEKRWKFNVKDLEARAKWPAFMKAYESILSRTSTPWAPWYVVPADRKWYRDHVVARLLKRALKSMDLSFPAAAEGLARVVIPD